MAFQLLVDILDVKFILWQCVTFAFSLHSFWFLHPIVK